MGVKGQYKDGKGIRPPYPPNVPIHLIRLFRAPYLLIPLYGVYIVPVPEQFEIYLTKIATKCGWFLGCTASTNLGGLAEP